MIKTDVVQKKATVLWIGVIVFSVTLLDPLYVLAQNRQLPAIGISGERGRVVFARSANVPIDAAVRVLEALDEVLMSDSLLRGLPAMDDQRVTVGLALEAAREDVDGWSSVSDRLIVLPLRKALSWDDRWLRRIIRHDVGHIHAGTFVGERPVPLWFQEGLAEWAAGGLTCEATIEGGGRTHTVEMTRAGDRIATGVDEGDLANFYNAVISGAAITRGATLVVQADPDGIVPLAPGSATRFPASGSEPLDVVAVPPMEVTVVPVVEAEEPDSSIFEWTDNIGDDSPEVGLFKYSFPFGRFTARSRETYVTSLDLTSDGGQWGLVLELEAVRAAEGGTGYWYGAAASVNGYVRGVAYRGGWVGMGKAWDTELAHEVGHNLNLRHAPCGRAGGVDPDFPHPGGSIGAWGFDFRDSTLVSPKSRRDIMGYCYEQGWLSDYYFEKVIDYREEVEGDGVGAHAAGPEDDVLVLWGGVVDGEIRLQPPFTMRAAQRLPDRPGPYRIVATDTGGRTAIDLSFTPGEDKFGNRYFFFTVPVEAGWADSLDQLMLSGPEGIVSLAADERALTIVTDPSTGRIRGLLLDWDGPLPAALGNTDALEVRTVTGLADAVRPPR